MSKKIYGLLLPILAVGAFASMTAAAQAVPHWYSGVCVKVTAGTGLFNNSNCTELGGTKEFELDPTRLPLTGAKTAVSTFGSLSLTVGTTTITCKVLDAGNIWNPNLTTAGEDEITQFFNYNCTISPAAACTAGLELVPSSLPWLSKLIEPKAGEFRDEITGIHITFKCTSPTVINETFTGTLKPLIANSRAEFGAGSGELTSAAGNKATVTGHDALRTTENEEPVYVKNP